ncbi:hypothetical protein Taro_002562, partial [Colocasia esculenta]|nr:hypothetical protein [Colocasia esculenta]
MLVWDTSTNRFAEFGSNQEIDVAFDILYAGDTSVIHQSLAERHALLQKVVRPVKGCLEILVPNGGLNVHRSSGEPCWSIVANSLEDVETFFKETVENRDEGIVLKDLGSKWEPSDRSGKWLKLKPDYIHAGADLDVLIIGGYFGSGRRGGEVAQFLMGLAEHSAPNSYPKRFISFCRVGTGLSDDELDSLVNKLKPYFRRNENPKKAPRFYEVTYNAKERPDVWVESPDKSVILSITSDIRTIKSEVQMLAILSLLSFKHFSFGYLIDVKYHILAFVDMVHSSNGSTQREGHEKGNVSKNVKSSKKRDKSVHVVPAHLAKTDVSGIKENTLIFANIMFYFVNVPSSYTIDYFHKLVAENGGTFSMNLNDSVTHCIAAEKKGCEILFSIICLWSKEESGLSIYQGSNIKQLHVMETSFITPGFWIAVQKSIFFIYNPKSSKRKFKEEIDSFSDYYYWDIDVTDLKQWRSHWEPQHHPGFEPEAERFHPTPASNPPVAGDDTHPGREPNPHGPSEDVEDLEDEAVAEGKLPWLIESSWEQSRMKVWPQEPTIGPIVQIMVQKLGRIGIGSTESARFWASRSEPALHADRTGSAGLGRLAEPGPIRLGSARAGPIRFNLVCHIGSRLRLGRVKEKRSRRDLGEISLCKRPRERVGGERLDMGEVREKERGGEGVEGLREREGERDWETRVREGGSQTGCLQR